MIKWWHRFGQARKYAHKIEHFLERTRQFLMDGLELNKASPDATKAIRQQLKFRIRIAALWSVASLVFYTCSPSMAADKFFDRHAAFIVGEIKVGDDEKFRALMVAQITKQLAENSGVGSVHIYSSGGNLAAAMKIAEQVYLLQLSTFAPRFDSTVSSDVTPGFAPRICDLSGEKERRAKVSKAHSEWLMAERKRGGRLGPI